MNAREADVVVVGAGIMGAAAAWRLACGGMQVTLFEQRELGHVRGSSHGMARIYRLAYAESDYVRLSQRALPLWREAQAELGEELLMTTGALDLGPPHNLDPIAAALEAAGERYERLSAAEARDRFPAFRFDSDWEVLFQPDGGVSFADAARLGLVELARRAGATIQPGTPVTQLDPDGDSVSVRTASGRVRARFAVVCTGAWANVLLAPLGLEVPLRVTREHVAYFPYVDSRRLLPFIWHESSTAFEYYGLPNGRQDLGKVAQHGAGPVVDPESDPVLEESRLAPVTEFVRAHVPALAPEVAHAETCLYATTPDDDFVIDREGPIVLGVGFGGHGFKFGAAIGDVLAGMVAGEPAPFPARFGRSRFADRVVRQPAAMR